MKWFVKTENPIDTQELDIAAYKEEFEKLAEESYQALLKEPSEALWKLDYVNGNYGREGWYISFREVVKAPFPYYRNVKDALKDKQETIDSKRYEAKVRYTNKAVFDTYDEALKMLPKLIGCPHLFDKNGKRV